MKRLIVVLVILNSINLLAQSAFEVTAKNGLILRDSPNINAQRLGKLPFGKEIEVIEKTGVQKIITDGDKQIKGEWVKIRFENYPNRISNTNEGFVFDGYLISKKAQIAGLKLEVSNFDLFQNYEIVKEKKQYHIRGDFFGDGFEDLAILIQDSTKSIKIGIINYGHENKAVLIGGANDPFEIYDYNWVDIFKTVNRGEVLWSNYTDDFRAFKIVPSREKIILNYEAIYIHKAEACGGGFVFWKNGKFHWLQQE